MTTTTQDGPAPDHLDEAQFDDFQGSLEIPDNTLVFANLFTAPVMRGTAALLIGLVLLSTPRTPRLFAITFAIFLSVWAVGEAIDVWRGDDRSMETWVKIGGIGVVAVIMVAWPGATENVLARIVGWSLIGYALYQTVRRLRRGGSGRVVGLLADALTATVGIALVLIPNLVFEVVLLALAVTWIIGGIAAIVTGLRPQTEAVEIGTVWATILEWIEGRPNTADDRIQLYEKLFYEGPLAKRRLSRFTVLMSFATAIAGYGIAADSTAVVVGAMLIAPLMTPLMGTSVSFIMGWPKRAAMSALVASFGVLLAIGLAWIIGGSISFALDPQTNSQIAGRINPTMIDLAIAIAAGGAGAFALSRPDVSDALPGVAVAIALVPPLAVTGLMLREADYEAAFGAFLLFSTNAVAILLTGALVFILTGVVPIRQLARNAQWIRSVLMLLGLLAAVITVALFVSGQRLEASAFDQGTAADVVDEWVGDQNLDVVNIAVTTKKVRVAITGPEAPPDVGDLGRAMEDALGRRLDVEISWIPQTEFLYEAPG